MLGDGLEILRPVIEGRFGMPSTACQQYTTDQQGKEGANRPGQTSPASSMEAFRVAEYALFRSVARVYAGRFGVADLEVDRDCCRPHILKSSRYTASSIRWRWWTVNAGLSGGFATVSRSPAMEPIHICRSSGYLEHVVGASSVDYERAWG
jgi:hypothetical protein